jgi:ribonuclease P protein component
MKIKPLNKKSDFSNMRKDGRRFNLPYITIVYLPNNIETRIAFALSRKLANSVMRNKVRRRIREIVRLHCESNKLPYDILFIPKKSILGAEYSDIKIQIEKFFNHKI